jgi:3-oxoadipate enol-lactonase
VHTHKIHFLLLCGFLAAPRVDLLSEPAGPTFPQERSALNQVESGFVDVVGGRIFYEKSGRGEPIVMLHDGLIHREVWDEQFATFSKNYTVIRYDRRGYGRSTKPTAPYSNIEDLLIVLESLKIPRAHFMGMSAGGGLAIDFALAHPEKVSSLVLVGAVVSGLGFTDHFYDRGGNLRESDRASEASLREYWLWRDPYEIAFENEAARKKAARLLEANPQNTDPGNHRLLRGPERAAIGALGEIKVPTHILVGEYDIPDVHAHAGAIEAGIPGAQRVIVRHAGHLVPLEQPEVFDRIVMDFLKSGSFFSILSSEGVEKAVQYFHEARTKDPDAVLFSEDRLNRTAYQLLRSGRTSDAIELFALNVLAYPDSWNVYDSLAEAELVHGDTELAIQHYEKSIELNPENANAVEMLKKLRGR